MAFGLRFADRVPAWRSQRKYETAEARCKACTLRGGREEPCESPAALRFKWQKRYGQQCPRVDLWPENRVALRVAQLLLNEELRGLAPAYAAQAGPEDAEGQARLTMIVAGALNDRRVQDERRALMDRMSKRPAGRNMLDREPPTRAGSQLPLTLTPVKVVDGRPEA